MQNSTNFAKKISPLALIGASSNESAQRVSSHVGLAAKESSFRSASELAQLFKLAGKQFDALQLSPGTVNGRFALARIGSIALLKISTTQRLLLNGDRGPDCISFCLEASGQAQDHRVFSVPIAAYSINGFRQGMQESHFELSANSTTYLAITSAQRFNTYLERYEEDHLIELMQASNALQMSPLMHQYLAQEFEQLLHTPLTTAIQRQQVGHHLYTLFLKCLRNNRSGDSYIPFANSPRQQLVHELIRWGFRNSNTKPNLDVVSQNLYASRRTLIQGTKETFDIGPIELLKRIRLEQVKGMLCSEELRHAAGLNTVTEVAQHFGFRSRGHFAKDYQQQFAESPSATLNQALS